MEGYWFLWSAWFIWIYATFLLNRQHPYRFVIALVTLIQVVVYPFQFQIGEMMIQGPFFVLGIFLFIWLARYEIYQKIYFLLTVWITGMFYASFLFIEVYDPIWIVLDRRLLFPLLLTISLLLLFKKEESRWAVALMGGGMLGEMLVFTTFRSVGLPYKVGGSAFLDVLFLTMLFTSISFHLSASMIRLQMKIPLKKEKQITYE
ncbi:YphA family membrane protein [Bacillus sp. 2205SS5-2]|uniref:YphA family membrane protein n=1 Tax=Bacillus sp. 2205SS5-2 TaxID=3109031 RepID=UPI003003C45B